MSTVQEFDFSVDLLKALLWQHENAERLQSLLTKKQEWYDANLTAFWSDWYRDVFDLDTANAFGLSVWARILDVSLFIETANTVATPHFGFGANHLNFNNGNFAQQAGQQGLDVEQARLVLKLRYLQLISRGSVTEINEWLFELFGQQGKVFVVDSLDMTFATYFFSFEPDSRLRFILEEYDLLPRPAAVGVRYQVQVRDSFGFGTNHLNFENGNFGA